MASLDESSLIQCHSHNKQDPDRNRHQSTSQQRWRKRSLEDLEICFNSWNVFLRPYPHTHTSYFEGNFVIST